MSARVRPFLAAVVTFGALMSASVRADEPAPDAVSSDAAPSTSPGDPSTSPGDPSTSDGAPAGSDDDAGDAARAGRALRLAVYDLEVDEALSARAVRLISDALVVEIRKRERVSVIGMDEVRAMLDLEANKQAMGCDGEDSCLSEIADALGVDGIVTGSIATVGEERVFAVKRIDQRAARTVGSVTRRMPPSKGEEVLAEIGPVVETLFPDHGLRPGTTLGVDPAVGRRLNPPPLPSWLLFSAGAATGALVVGALGAGVAWAFLNADYVALVERSRTEVVDGATLTAALDRAVLAQWTAWGLVGVAGLAAVGTAGLVPFTDFEGDE